MTTRSNNVLALFFITLFALMPYFADARAPMVDAHIHYNWNQAETLSPEEAIARLQLAGVEWAAVSSTPSALVLKLEAVAPERIVPLFSPYITPRHRHTWFYDEAVVKQARDALASGRYRGIGEVHLIPGLGPRRGNPIFQALLDLAEEHEVPFLLHTDASNYRYVLPICRQHPKLQFIWAHAGGIVPPEQVIALLEACPRVAVDLAARDPWRYTATPITDQRGRLKPGWQTLVERFPDRVLVGSDALWPVEQMYGWYEADSGWQLIDRYVDFHRGWLFWFPPEIQHQVLRENATRIYGARR